MNTLALSTIALSLCAAACASPAGSPDLEEPAALAAPRAQGAALRLEQAERSLDVGRDVAAARATLEEIVRDPATTPEQRDQARLSLSRALEAGGDREAAIAAVEALLGGHADGARFPLEEAAEARLRKLLTGKDAEPRTRLEDGHEASAFARALAKYFPAPREASHGIDIPIVAFGGSRETSERLGTFAVDRAMRAERRESCPLCDERLPIHASASYFDSWTAIPQSRARLDRALTVFYFDLEDGRVPARYDAELPLPSAEIVAHLEKGEGLLAARERPGAPPAILIAAPREAQLAQVEEALAEMKKLPTSLQVVEVSPGLKAQEIQRVMRASFGAFRGCYEAVLKRAPGASGKAILHYSIGPDGVMSKLSIETTDGLRDTDFELCMSGVANAVTFPATKAKEMTVTYPIAFAPGD